MLHAWLDLGSKAFAAQEFRHTTQGESQLLTLPGALRGLSKIAYGRDALSDDTRDTLSAARWHELRKAPAVTGTEIYKTLCMVTRNEEKHPVELKKMPAVSKGSTFKATTAHSEASFHSFEGELYLKLSSDSLLKVPQTGTRGEGLP